MWYQNPRFLSLASYAERDGCRRTNQTLLWGTAFHLSNWRSHQRHPNTQDPMEQTLQKISIFQKWFSFVPWIFSEHRQVKQLAILCGVDHIWWDDLPGVNHRNGWPIDHIDVIQLLQLIYFVWSNLICCVARLRDGYLVGELNFILHDIHVHCKEPWLSAQFCKERYLT